MLITPQAPQLDWLPAPGPDWRPAARALSAATPDAWAIARGLAQHNLDFLKTNMLDEVIRRRGIDGLQALSTRDVRLAVLGSSTLTHLLAPIRVASVRRNVRVATFEGDYGQYLQELLDPGSALHHFNPTAVLFAFDARSLTEGLDGGATPAEAEAKFDESCRHIRQCWQLAHDRFACSILQQTILPTLPDLMGGNEHRLPGSRAAMVARLNEWLRQAADENGVHLIALDRVAARDGLAAWHSAALWHRTKQDVSPSAAPVYGDLVARVLAAEQGLSSKCLVLDLDNTLWGGVIGDDGVDGIVLGQGSAQGEAFVAVQAYARHLAARGVILAVCSKNDEANALEAFERHPEMVLRRSDISCFKASWSDKASALREIARELNIGIDSLVLLDDNPFERDLVRRELPGVAAPELQDDPATYPDTLVRTGYFEGLTVTAEDRERSAQYQSMARTRAEIAEVTDLEGYLRGLDMQLLWRPIDQTGLQRVVQLINKTNQFNLTTRRYTEAEILGEMADPKVFSLQLRLRDRQTDHGIIAVIIGRVEGDAAVIDTWLMSCRVLGRQVEAASLQLVVDAARRLGARTLIGIYKPTAKNAMVRDHYAKLGFRNIEDGADGSVRSALPIAGWEADPIFINIVAGE